MVKEMEKYLRKVRRRLNMPKEAKDRVMADFASSIEARIEDGQSEDTILSELGKPKQASAELNRQMQEYIKVIASAHGSDRGILRRQGIGEAVKAGAFDRILLLKKDMDGRRIEDITREAAWEY